MNKSSALDCIHAAASAIGFSPSSVSAINSIDNSTHIKKVFTFNDGQPKIVVEFTDTLDIIRYK